MPLTRLSARLVSFFISECKMFLLSCKFAEFKGGKKGSNGIKVVTVNRILMRYSFPLPLLCFDLVLQAPRFFTHIDSLFFCFGLVMVLASPPRFKAAYWLALSNNEAFCWVLPFNNRLFGCLTISSYSSCFSLFENGYYQFIIKEYLGLLSRQSPGQPNPHLAEELEDYKLSTIILVSVNSFIGSIVDLMTPLAGCNREKLNETSII